MKSITVMDIFEHMDPHHPLCVKRNNETLCNSFSPAKHADISNAEVKSMYSVQDISHGLNHTTWAHAKTVVLI